MVSTIVATATYAVTSNSRAILVGWTELGKWEWVEKQKMPQGVFIISLYCQSIFGYNKMIPDVTRNILERNIPRSENFQNWQICVTNHSIVKCHGVRKNEFELHWKKCHWYQKSYNTLKRANLNSIIGSGLRKRKYLKRQNLNKQSTNLPLLVQMLLWFN